MRIVLKKLFPTLKTVAGLDLDSNQSSFENKGKYVKTSIKQRDILAKEINTLMHKQVISESVHEAGEFISPIFLRPKGEDQFRLIVMS